MKEQEKLERLRNVAEACAKSGVRDHNEYGISYDPVERMLLPRCFCIFLMILLSQMENVIIF